MLHIQYATKSLNHCVITVYRYCSKEGVICQDCGLTSTPTTAM